jgi:hypothetical protein
MTGNTTQIGASGNTRSSAESSLRTRRATRPAVAGAALAKARVSDGADDIYEGRRVSPVDAQLRAHWPVFVLFLAGLISVGLYIVAIALRWIDWAGWSPVALAAVFVAWASAIRINLIAQG